MLEKPNLSDEKLIACVRDAYGLHVREVAFLPLGNDVHTAVYRAVADDGTPYFVKLRSGAFDEAAIAIPHFLSDCGIRQIIAPIATQAGRLWSRVDTFAVIVSPFVAGRNGFDAPLSDRQWTELGVALKGVHTATVPQSLSASIPRETYAPHWRDLVRTFQQQVEETTFPEPVAAQLAAFMRERRDEISAIVARAEELSLALQARVLDQVLCHADIHGGNVLVGADGALHIVDWDTLIFAPKERDLMFIGGGIAGVWNSASEETWFYRGYGPTQIDLSALAYYRYERIVEDFAAYGEQLLLTDEGGADREAALGYFRSQFQPNEVIEIAYATDRRLRAESGAQ